MYNQKTTEMTLKKTINMKGKNINQNAFGKTIKSTIKNKEKTPSK